MTLTVPRLKRQGFTLPPDLFGAGPVLVPHDYSPEKQGITQSLIKMKRECDVKARMYARGYSRSSSMGKAQAQGSVIHYGLEYFHTETMEGRITSVDQVLELKPKLLRLLSDHFQREYVRLDAKSKQEFEMAYGVAAVLVPAYFKHWKKDFKEDKKTWIELERSGKITVDGVPVRYKKDGLFRAKDGKLWLKETKTKDKWNDRYIGVQAAREFQNLLYLLATWEEYSEVPGGVVYDLVRRPQIKQGVKETMAQYIAKLETDVAERPGFYFQRYPAPVLEADLIEHRRKLKLELAEFKRWWKSPPEDDIERTDSCFNFGRPCQYFDYCASRKKNFAGLEIRPDTHEKYTQLEIEEE